MKSTAEILELLRVFKAQSVARGEQTNQSDVDICYESEPPSLLTLERIQSELEELLGCSVDLIRIREHMNSRLKQRILNEGVYV